MRASAHPAALAAVILVTACQGAVAPPDPQAALVARGERIFFEETFAGNGRTCGTCHRAEESFTLTPAFIATLPDDDPLFVAELQPALAENFEKPELMRRFGLILENLDGFDDLANRFVMRGVPHVLALRTSVQSPAGPRTGCPFFHNNAVRTIVAAVAFYAGESFNASPAGRLLASTDPDGEGIALDGAEIDAVAAFLRVINSLENIRASAELLDRAASKGFLELRKRDRGGRGPTARSAAPSR